MLFFFKVKICRMLLYETSWVGRFTERERFSKMVKIETDFCY